MFQSISIETTLTFQFFCFLMQWFLSSFILTFYTKRIFSFSIFILCIAHLFPFCIAKIYLKLCIILWGLPRGSVVKSQPANVGDAGDEGFDPWVGKIPWRRKWQPSPIFLPGKYLGQRSLAGYSLQGRKRVGHDRATEYTYIDSNFYCIAYFINKNSCYFTKILRYNKWCINCFITVNSYHTAV